MSAEGARVSAKQLSLVAFLILLPLSLTSFANDNELVAGKVREGMLSAGQPESFVVSLNAGDFAQIKFDPRGKELVVITYDPSGNRFRGATVGPDEGEFTFIAERASKYRIEVAAVDKREVARLSVKVGDAR
jgi:hypothetical protein